MSRSSSRMPGASISRNTAGNGPLRSGRQMNVSISPASVIMSTVSSIIRVPPQFWEPRSAFALAPSSIRRPARLASQRLLRKLRPDNHPSTDVRGKLTGFIVERKLASNPTSFGDKRHPMGFEGIQMMPARGLIGGILVLGAGFDTHLRDVAGFLEFHLLHGPEREDHVLYTS